MSHKDYSNHPGNIIWKQLTVMTKMSCGARQPVLLTQDEQGICFKVHSKPMRYIEVILDPSDTYTVRYLRLKRGSYERITLEEHAGIYVDMLNETVYHAVNK